MQETKLHRIFVLVIIVAGMAFVSQRAAGQANRGTITGTVTDSTGAIVPGVEVTATNTGTNVPAKTLTNQDGIYVIPNLFPGPYSLEFKRDGFQAVVHTSITLESTQVARIDASLKVSTVLESVTVTTQAPVLDLERPSEGTNMKGNTVNDLPLSIYGGGRFLEDFAVALTPGYSPISSPYGAVVNGGQWFTKEFTVDGTSGTTNIRGDSMEAGPTMEAVQELQAQTSGLDAQSAVSGAGVMSFNLKSGTNKLHGSALLYGHNELLDANTWTNDYYHVRKGQKRAWDYAFSLGGPIIKNKTFIFGAFERYTQTDFRLNSGSASVPTTKMLNGDFSELLGGELCNQSGNVGLCSSGGGTPLAPVYNDAGQQVQPLENMIYDPNPPDTCPVAPCQFTGNVIPADRISAFAKNVNAFYKDYAPQFGGIDNNSKGLIQNTPRQTPNEIVIKVDHTLREQDHLSASWIYNHKPRTLDDGGGLWQEGTHNGGPLSNGRLQMYWVHEGRISETHTFNSHLLNVANFTFNIDYNMSRPSDPGNWNQQLGFGNTGADTFPLISFNDSYPAAYGHNETYLGNTWQGDFSGVNTIVGDTVTWIKGRHNFSFGGDFTAHQINSHTGQGALSFDFPWWETSGAGYPYDGYGYATFLLGYVDKASTTVPHNLYGRQKGISLFAQDSYKVTPKLTVNLGLRWNYNFRFHEKNGNWASFDEHAISPSLGIPGTLVFGKGGGDSFEKNEYHRNFGPTVGFAYQVLHKTVVRGSYGLIFNPVGVAFFQGVPNGFSPQLGTSQAQNYWWDTVPNGYPGVVTRSVPDASPYSLFGMVSLDPRALRLGYSEAFNFGIQQELTPNTRLEVSYVGNRGHRLTDTALAWNQGPTSQFQSFAKQYGTSIAFGNYVCDPSVTDCFNKNDVSGGAPCPWWVADYYAFSTPETYGIKNPYAGFCGPLLSAIAPFPQMAAAEGNYWYYANLQYAGLPLGQSFYDSLVVNVVKRTGSGLTMDMSYTWSRQEGDTFSSQQDYNGYYTPVQDFSNMRQAAHAVTGYDLPHIVKGFVSYELPFGKGRRWVVGQNRLLNAVVSGWTITGVFDYHTGQPFHVGASNPYWPMWGNIYPVFNLTGFKGALGTSHFVPVPDNASTIPAGNFYMPAEVASNPAVGELPPSPASSRLRCPGQKNEDASILKNFGIGENGRYRLQFRAEFYNLLNRHYYNINGCGGNNNNSVGASNFGQIFSVADNPRTGQFGIRFDF